MFAALLLCISGCDRSHDDEGPSPRVAPNPESPTILRDPVQEKLVVERRPEIQVALERQKKIVWHLHRNWVVGTMVDSNDSAGFGRTVLAADVSGLTKFTRQGSVTDPSFDAWSKHFPDAVDLRYNNGYASVVDENVFTNLRIVNGTNADKLNLDGVVIGRVKLEEYDPVELVYFLVESGIVDANIHMTATVRCTHFSSDNGDWFSLHSSDRYWTNQENHVNYAFGIHIGEDGTIRMVKNKDVGRLPAEE